MQPFDLETASLLLDFTGGDEQLKQLGQLQLEGAVALQNMLANTDIGVGYLADEVGMGKTYVALGVVALMRSFNPSLRVLYICPSTNVQEKWCYRELPAFIKKNFRGTNFTIRTPQGEPGTPAVFCNNVEELITAATTGYYGDVFVRMSSFSMSMSDDADDLERQLARLRNHVPASVLGHGRVVKKDIKRAYARALNYLLPTFDLVVIDEAHNFKHSFESSARNLALSRILGFNSEDGEVYSPRVKRALLLSATPFDVNAEHLVNQLALVGKSHLLPSQKDWDDKLALKTAMTKFMVRRLNALNIRGEAHTRNMYRREWRKGAKAEIKLPSDEHKLITALVQKHVGDMLNKQGGSPAFQLGLLASFESYAQTSRLGDVAMFDGNGTEKTEKSANEAPDRHLIDIIRTGYVQEERFGSTLPHPKMDQVSREVALQALDHGRKQLVFVRRVRSVNELKQKLDDEYNAWLERHLLGVLSESNEASTFAQAVIDTYKQASKDRDDDISGGEVRITLDGNDEQVAAKTDTLFNWFFRGEKPAGLERVLSDHGGWPVPDNLKKSLVAKNNANVICFEFNWLAWLAKAVCGESIESLLESMDDSSVLDELARLGGLPDDDQLSTFLAVQVACLRALCRQRPDLAGVGDLADYLAPVIRSGKQVAWNMELVRRQLRIRTFFNCLEDFRLEERLFSSPRNLANCIRQGERLSIEGIHRVELHRQLIAQSLRTGHPFIDLYLSRLRIGAADVTEERRQLWLSTLSGMLSEQLSKSTFSSARELALLNDNLDLVIKNNLPQAFAKGPAELRLWLNHELPSSAPVIGATGETRGSRSVQARKFRMPGYPLILVSTDVFQEGEDLHTFCDSVVHYGLASSPVSIEQKTGRVDRVGAYAHRRLLGLQQQDDVVDEDYIQVSFPYVKQSIEAIQVRVLARRMNEFLGSLHEIGGKSQAMNAFVDSSRELADQHEIPDQLLEFLESPYIPVLQGRADPKMKKMIYRRSEEDQQALCHVLQLVKAAVGAEPDRNGRLHPAVPELLGKKFNVEISSARSHGEVLLKIRQDECLQVLLLQDWSAARVCELQGEIYSTSLARTFGLQDRDGFVLYHEAEMLVGNDDVTCQGDVLGLFRRFRSVDEDSESLSREKFSLSISDDEALIRLLQKRYRWNGAISSKPRRDGMEIVFKFNDESRRRHLIRVRQTHGYCLFEAMIANADVVRTLSRDRLLALTWVRNHGIDLVEALVRPDGCLVARALHPMRSMGEREFLFTAYVLAVEADRLEYLIKEPDEY
jgi:hypothetical protein